MEPLPVVEYLLEVSRDSLKNFHLAQLAKSSNARKDARAALDKWVEASAMALLAEWFEQHGAELVALAASGQRIGAERGEMTKCRETLGTAGLHQVPDPLADADPQRPAVFRLPHGRYRHAQARRQRLERES